MVCLPFGIGKLLIRMEDIPSGIWDPPFGIGNILFRMEDFPFGRESFLLGMEDLDIGRSGFRSRKSDLPGRKFNFLKGKWVVAQGVRIYIGSFWLSLTVGSFGGGFFSK